MTGIFALEYLNYRNGQGYLTGATLSAILDHQNAKMAYIADIN